MTIRHTPSPNHDSRGGVSVDMLVLHYTGMRTAEEAITRLCDPASKVSAHFVVDEEGVVHHLVAESERAWHAGVSSWRGQQNINARSIGIEIVNPGHEFGYRPFTDKQMAMVIALSKHLVARFAIQPRNVVGHSDIAPERKEDPGELFDWPWLAREGIGLYPDAMPQEWDGNRGRLIERLSNYGYGVAEENLDKTIIAFRRHFNPAQLQPTWDDACEGMLEALLVEAIA